MSTQINKNTGIFNKEEVINDPACSFWLKEQFSTLDKRDICDAIADVEVLLCVLISQYHDSLECDVS